MACGTAGAAHVASVHPDSPCGELVRFGPVIFGSHEFGHLFFAVGGGWLTVAGGNLMQLIIAGAAGLVIAKTAGDWFALPVCGAWLAASLGDLATYIADARAMELDLLSFSEDASGHDWNYLLAHAGMLGRDLALARGTRFVAVIVLIASWWIAITLLQRMAARRTVAAAVVR